MPIDTSISLPLGNILAEAVIPTVPVLTLTLFPDTATNTLTPPGSANGAPANVLPPKYIFYPNDVCTGSQVIVAPGTIPSHFLINTEPSATFILLPSGVTEAFATMVTVPLEIFCLFVVTVTVAFALVVTLPTPTSTLFPVTDILASADIVTVPVPKFTCDPFGNTVALPTIVGSPVSVFILFPVTE